MQKRADAGTPSNGEPTAASAFFDHALLLLEKLKRTQSGVIQQAADLCADRIARGGLVFLFGNGHSRMMCEEMTPRQGCFPGFVALVELALSNHAAIVGANGLRAPLYLEKYEGYAEQILRGFRFGKHDAFIVISTSGIRPVVVEMAMGAQQPRTASHRDRLQSALRAGEGSAFLGQETDRLRRHRDRQPVSSRRLRAPVAGPRLADRPASTVTGAMIINMIRCAHGRRLAAARNHSRSSAQPPICRKRQRRRAIGRFYEAYRKSLAHLFE